MSSLFFFVGKKDRGLQPCQDYWYLNEETVKNAYPLSLISKLIDKLATATLFTKLDLQNRYNNVHIWEEDQWKATFTMNWGLFEPNIMFFGMTNALATFQYMMNDICKDLIAEGWIVIYMDNILIFSSTHDEYLEHTKRVLQQLQDHDLFLKPEKCQFNVTKINFLSITITSGRLHMDTIKVEDIAA